MNKKLFIVVLVLAIAFVSACTVDMKYIGEGGNARSWVCPDGQTTVNFERGVSSKVAEFQCNARVKVSEPVQASDQKSVQTIEDPQVVPVQTGPTCEDRATKISAPSGSSICKAPVSGAPAMRVQSGSQVEFGTITFDAETRVWILEKFIAPNGANYSFDYTGREQNVLDAPFVVGGEKNPVNGENFSICWDTEGDCTPPMAIEFFQ